MAIRHTRGSRWMVEGELPNMEGYAIEDIAAGEPSSTFAFGRYSYMDCESSPLMPDYLRHSHGGRAGYVAAGYSSVIPTWHRYRCRVPECPASNIWPCVRIILGRKCDYCGDSINNP